MGTVNLGLGYLVAGQAQKEITHNEALNDLDCLAQISVVSRGSNTPPASPVAGEAYLVGTSPTGDWGGFAGSLAYYSSGWRFKTPRKGWVVYVQAEKKLIFFDGTAWVFLASGGIEATASWTPGTLANGAGATLASVSVSGAALGDVVRVAAPYDMQGILFCGYVNAANSVAVRVQNMTGASVTLGAGTWRVRVEKA